MMTVTAQDGKLTFNPETGRWEDEDGNIGWEHKRVCSQCGKPRLDLNGVSDCDFCLQALTSCDFIDNACCGHGVDKNAYISLKDGRRFALDTVSKEVVNKLNELSEENKQLRKTEKINMEYAEQIVEENQKLRIAKNDLRMKNEQLQKTIDEVMELLVEEVDLFSNEAIKHDIIAYKEMNQFDNKDAYYMCISTKKAIKMLQRCLDE